MRVTPDVQRPLSFAEERLWFIEQLGGRPTLYNTALRFALDGEVDVAALRAAVSKVAQRHEAFRTRYVEADDTPRARIGAEARFDLTVSDLIGTHPTPAEVEARLSAFAAEPFDLTVAPLARAMMLRLAPDRAVLLLVAHHIIFDGASIDVWMTDLAAAYIGACAEPTPGLGGAIERERRALDGPRRQAMMDWWLDHLNGELPTLAIPTDRPRPVQSARQGHTLSRPAPSAVLDDLAVLCRGRRATLFMGLLAAWSGWLSRYASQAEVVVGTPFSLRGAPQTHDLIGYLVNTLPLRLDLSGRPSLEQVIDRARQVSLGAFPNAELPFGDLSAALGAPRGLSAAPLFQSMLVVQPRLDSRQLAENLRLTFDGELAIDRARFDLTLVLDYPAAGPRLSLEYDLELFDPTTAERMFDHFLAFLAAAVAAPQAALVSLDMLNDSERQVLIAMGEGPRRAIDARPCHSLVADQAARQPDAIAVVWDEGVLTYGELEVHVDRASDCLRRHGVGRETPVGVLMERGPDLVCALLAVMRAGGTYLPLDPALPDERLAFMLGDARPTVVIADAVLLKRAESLGARTATWSALVADDPASGDAAAVAPADRAYVIYTSGSTGRPKGVEVTHGALTNLIAAKIEGFDVRPESRVLQFVSFGFDVSVSDVLMTLAVGATLVLRPEEIVGGASLARVLREQAVSVIVLPASVLATLPDEDLPALRSVIAGGEACSSALVDRWAGPGRRFVNAYGPTEATICSTMAICRPGEGLPPLGQPIANAEVYVLDATLEPTPPGVVGEIYIGGAGLARGYLNRPDLTAERFAPHPFGPPGRRLYRTGDLGRRRADGALIFVGRADDQVKVRGVRIELGEIEAVLREHPSVEDALALVEGEGADRRLVAYVVGPAFLAPADLRDHARARLAEAMTPAAIQVLSAFPRTANGKIDRRVLPRADVPTIARITPRTLTEEILADIWSEVLGRTVGVEDDFFTVGGQSILATQVIARVRRQFEIGLGVRALFEAPTIAALAAKVEDAILAQIDADPA
jgi:amino acid adenylation domain-containing protein